MMQLVRDSFKGVSVYFLNGIKLYHVKERGYLIRAGSIPSSLPILIKGGLRTVKKYRIVKKLHN